MRGTKTPLRLCPKVEATTPPVTAAPASGSLPDVCPVGAIYSEEHVPDGKSNTRYNAEDPNKGHDHTFFIDHSRAVFAD